MTETKNYNVMETPPINAKEIQYLHQSYRHPLISEVINFEECSTEAKSLTVTKVSPATMSKIETVSTYISI